MERLHFENLDQYLFVKNGNYLYKVPYRDGFAVLKVYYGSRSSLEYLYKTFDNVVISGQTSFMPKARLRTEQRAMRIWKEAGFRVFDIYDAFVDDLPEGGYALYEYVPGRHLHKLLPDDSVSLHERIDVYRQFLQEWGSRHDLAVRRAEPRLIHENGDLKHVMNHNGELVWFDFEMCFRSRSHVEDLVSREILSYLKSLADFVPGDLQNLFFRETMEHYPRKDFLANTYSVAFRNRNPLIRMARSLDRRLRARARKPHSKYNVALRVARHLGIPTDGSA